MKQAEQQVERRALVLTATCFPKVCFRFDPVEEFQTDLIYFDRNVTNNEF